MATQRNFALARGPQLVPNRAAAPQALFRLGCVVSHPIQYQAPLFRRIAQDPEIDLTVFYMSDMSVRGFYDREFEVPVKWDVPLLGGYRHVFLKRFGGATVTPLLRPLAVGLEDAFRRCALDAVWLFGYKHQVQLRAIYAARRLGIPILVRGESSGLDRGLTRGISDRVVRRLFRVVEGFLYIGTRNRQFYADRGVEDGRLFFVPYAVDNGRFQDAARRAGESRAGLRESLRIFGGAPVILFAGKLCGRKRPLDLLLAYHRVVREFARGSEPYLVLAGDGELRERLERTSAELGLERVRIAGFVNQSEMPRFYELCDVFVLPSERENWGLAVNEAMNAGKPIVVSDRVGCAPDLVRAGQNGFVAPVGDVVSLGNVLSLILTDNELRAAMGRMSVRIISQFSFEQDLLGLKKAVRQVCRSRSGDCGVLVSHACTD